MTQVGMTAYAGKPSLRSRVVRHVMLPLALTWLMGTLVAVATANYFAQQAFDRSLLDDAYSVASNVRYRDGVLDLGLSPSEIGNVLFDQSENVFFAVMLPDGQLVAGHPGLRAPPLTEDQLFGFGDTSYQGKSLRSVTLKRSEPAKFVVVMAQTTLSRSRLLQRLAAYSLAPQLVFLVLLAWWLRRAIEEDLQPLVALQQAVDLRDASDLTPVHPGATTRDIERLGDAINALLLRIGAGVRAQREFAGNVAHELRTPLAGIRALADYGLSQKDPLVWRRQLEGIAASQARASHLVDQLLALALAEEARTGLQLQEVLLDEMVRDAVLRFLPRADAAGVDLGAQGLEQPLRVTGHSTLLEGILDNLLDNALRYGRATGGDVSRITVALSRTGAEAVLSVVDNGPGIALAEQQALVQRWAQGPAGVQLGEGAGLGLAIVAQYARAMGVPFSLEVAQPDGGLCASLRFRCAEDPAAPGPGVVAG